MRLVVRRTGACGDVIQAIPIVKALETLGNQVDFECASVLHGIARRFGIAVRSISRNHRVHINLDGSYERFRNQMGVRSMLDMYLEHANSCLKQLGISIPSNLVPQPKMLRSRVRQKMPLFVAHSRPWVAICPRSCSFRTKTVPDDIWNQAAKLLKGTAFWIGIHAPAPVNIIELSPKSFEDVADMLECVDAIATTDTGPMHIAASLNVPVVAIHQAYDPVMMLNRYSRVTVVKSTMDCITCCHLECPKDKEHPPCNDISPEYIARTVNSVT